MQETVVMPQATTKAPATNNSKDDRNFMTVHNNRTANTVWMTSKAGMLLKSEMTAAAGTTASSRISSVVGLPEQTVEKPAMFSRDTSNSSRDNKNITAVKSRSNSNSNSKQ
jgi:hypothetical protein